MTRMALFFAVFFYHLLLFFILLLLLRDVLQRKSYGFGYCTGGRGKSSDTAGRPTCKTAKGPSARVRGTQEGQTDRGTQIPV